MNKKQRKTSNTVLLVLALYVALFTVAMTVTYWVKGGVPDTLIQYTLGAGGVEVLMLAAIKVAKVWTTGKTGESEERHDI